MKRKCIYSIVIIITVIALYITISPIFEAKLPNSLGMKFVKIEAGNFTMGSNKNYLFFGYPHKVTITKGFYIQNTEVTIGQWKKFIEKTRFKTQAERDGFAWVKSHKVYNLLKKKGYYWNNPGYKITDNYPVTMITWEDVQEFIKWLNSIEKFKYRLPTEAEWEYACRAGTTTNFSNGAFTYGDMNYENEFNKVMDDAGWYWYNSDGHPHEVALKLPNPWGIFDMHGNISEFCQDYFSLIIPKRHEYDPLCKTKFSTYGVVVRGGSWFNIPFYNNSSIRSYEDKNIANNLRGFRLVRELK